MGGTFDPIHLGHLRAAESAREGLGLDLVAFVPSSAPPHRAGPMALPADRLTMVRLAIAGHPRFDAWDTELKRPGPSYTVDTVAALVAERPADSFVLIVGSDTWPEILTWREPARLLSLVTVGIVERPGRSLGELPRAPFPSARGVIRVEGPTLAISATEIRECARRGASLRYLVPEAVAEFIARRRLYA